MLEGRQGRQPRTGETDRQNTEADIKTPNAKVSSREDTQVQPGPSKVSCHFISFTLDLCSSMVIPVARFYKITVDPLTPKTK